MRGRAWLIAALAFLPLACTYSPKVTPASLQCKDDNGCPSGYRCVGATAVVAGFCCNQPDAAACTRPLLDAAHGPDTTGKDVPPDVSRDVAPDAPIPDTLAPPDRVQPDRATDKAADLATDTAPDAPPADAASERSETGDLPADVPTDVPIGNDGGPDVSADTPQDITIVPPIDAPGSTDTEPAIDTHLDAGTAPLITAIEGTGTAAAIVPRAEDMTAWNAYASDRVAAAKRISSTKPVIAVTGYNLDGITQATLAGQSGQGTHQMTIEEKTMTNLKLHWPSTLTAGGLFVLSLTAASGTATAQVFFLQGEKGDKGDSAFTCTDTDCTTTKNVSVSGLFTAAGGFTAGAVKVGPETTRTINVDSSMTADQIQSAIDGIGRHLPAGRTVTVQFADGTYTLNHVVSVSGFYGGGTLALKGNPAQIATDALRTDQSVYLDFGAQDSYGIYVAANSIQVAVEGQKIRVKSDTGGQHAIHIAATPYVTIRNCYLLGTSTTQGVGLLAQPGTEVALSYTNFSNISVAVQSLGGFVFSDSNASADTPPMYSLDAVSGGTIAKNGSQPSGIEYTGSGGQIR